MMFNRNTIRILSGALIVALLASLIVLGLRATLIPKDSNIKAKVSPRVVKLADTIFYIDSTPNIVSYKWDFGDKTFDTTQSGFHVYKQPGNYTVSLTVKNAQNSLSKDIFLVRIEGTGYTYNQQDSVFKIVAPAEALQGEEVMFRVDGYGSDEFNWEFGDNSSSVTTTLSVVKHTFKKPGLYTVNLYTKNNKTPARFRIVISPEYDVIDTSGLAIGGSVDAGAESNNRFREYMQNIVNKENFDKNYNGLLKYTCSNPHIPIKVNNSSDELYAYCQYLRFHSNIIIQSVNLTYDSKGKCVVLATITEAVK